MKNLCYLFLFVGLVSCNTIDIYEKTKPFPSHEWKGTDRPSFAFEISDTASAYDIFFVFRHTDAYNYSNIWVNITTVPPGDTATTQPLDVKLADNQNGWLGSGMDDIFEHRIKITRAPIRLKQGKYSFTLQHIMREEPLQHVMNAGMRVEKIKP